MNYKTLIKKAKNSVCIILIIDENNAIVSHGTGFLYKEKNIVATCNHVINKPKCKIAVKFSSIGGLLAARVFLTNQEQDLALLKIEKQTLLPLLPQTSTNVKEGEEIVFLGYPLTKSVTTTHQGIISAILEDATGIKTIQIDGTINPGSSGSPLLDLNGKVLGVVNATRRESNELLEKVEVLKGGAFKLHDLDLIEIYQGIIKNLQLGIGYAIPISYLPELPKKGSKK